MLSYISLAVLFTAYVAPSVATPPACLLACAADVVQSSSTCSQLNDIACVCSSEASTMKSCLDSRCPNGLSGTAYTAFESICSGLSVQIGSNSSSSSAVSSSASSSTSTAVSSSTSAHPSTSSTSSEEPVTSSTSSAAPTTSTTANTTSSASSTTSTTSSAEKTTLSSSSVKPSSTSSGVPIQTNLAGSMQYNALLGAAAIAAVNLI